MADLVEDPQYLEWHNVKALVDENIERPDADPSIKAQVEFLLIRALHSAHNHDGAVVGNNADQDYINYWREITGSTGVQIYPNLDEAFADHHYDKVNPYMASTNAVGTVESYGAELVFPNHDVVIAGVVDRANDKAYFRKVAPEVGVPVAPDQTIINLDDTDEEKYHRDILTAVEAIIGRNGANYCRAFIQANKSAGGYGNLDVEFTNGQFTSSKLNEGKPFSYLELQFHLKAWVAARGIEGSTDIIVQPFIKPKASHTVSMYIPDDGSDPYIFGGIFQQRIDEASSDYLGFNWPAQDQYTADYGCEMESSALRWARHLQQRGYFGPTDVDYAIGDNPKTGEEILYASESNTRWDGFSFGLRYGARSQGWNFRTLDGINDKQLGISAHDHVITTLGKTSDIITKLEELGIPVWGRKDPDGHTNYDEGAVITMPTKKKSNGTNQFGLVYISKDGAPAAEFRIQNIIRVLSI